MISPVGKKLAELMREEADLPEPDELGPAEPEPSRDDPRYLMFTIKRRRQAALLKRMLTDAGYGDLAKMASVTTRGEIHDPQEQ